MVSIACVICSIIGLIGSTGAEIPNGLDVLDKPFQDLEQTVQDASIMNGTQFDAQDVERALRDKCEGQQAGDAVDALKEQQEALKSCLELHVNGTQIQEELAEAKKTGSMDDVFGKYCKKWPEVFGCLDNATITVRRCLAPEEAQPFNRTLDVVQELQEFMCVKDGDRLALFVAEGGVQCVQDQQEGLKQCFNSSRLGAGLPQNGSDLSFAALPIFAFQEQNCSAFETIRNCVKAALEQCSDTTPANIVDASFKFLKKQMACQQPKEVALQAEAVKPAGSAGRPLATAWALLGAVALLRGGI